MPVGCSVPVGLNLMELNLLEDCSVTNACRLFGPCWGCKTAGNSTKAAVCHQCLSAVRSLLGVLKEWESVIHDLTKSPMPVGCSVPVGGCNLYRKETNHETSPMPVGCSVPVGGDPDEWEAIARELVTNACRLFGPCWVRKRFGGKWEWLNRHQCLSAVRSLLGYPKGNGSNPN